MKSISWILVLFIVSGCSPRINSIYVKPSSWGVTLGAPLSEIKPPRYTSFYFEPALKTLPRLVVKESNITRDKSSSLLVGNYPFPGMVTQFSVLKNSVRVREVFSKTWGPHLSYKLKQIWKISDFVKCFKNADVRLHPDIGTGETYEYLNKIPNLKSATGLLKLYYNEGNQVIYVLDIYVDGGLVIAAKSSNYQEPDY